MKIDKSIQKAITQTNIVSLNNIPKAFPLPLQNPMPPNPIFLQHLEYNMQHRQSESIDTQSLQSNKNEWMIYITYMSLTVKVQFEDKLFKLTQGITTIAHVEEEMRKRYPKKMLHFIYYYEGCIVYDLEKVLEQAKSGKKNSVKLVAKLSEDVSIMSSDQNASIISIASSEVKSVLQPLKVMEKQIELPKIVYSIPKEFYVCYNCNGLGVYEHGSSNQLCEICEGRGEFTNQHRYVKRMQTLFSHFQKEKIEILQPKKPQFEKTFLKINKMLHLNIKEIEKIERMQIGKEFTYKFSILNTGKDLPQDLQIVDCDTKESIKVNTLKSGERMVVELGPFKCENEGLLEKAFYLCFRKENGWERLGYRFGFRIRGEKIQLKKVQNDSREMLKTFKMLSGSRKSQEYIEMKLKAMGIDLSNSDIEDQVLIQIISEIK